MTDGLGTAAFALSPLNLEKLPCFALAEPSRTTFAPSAPVDGSHDPSKAAGSSRGPPSAPGRLPTSTAAGSRAPGQRSCELQARLGQQTGEGLQRAPKQRRGQRCSTATVHTRPLHPSRRHSSPHCPCSLLPASWQALSPLLPAPALRQPPPPLEMSPARQQRQGCHLAALPCHQGPLPLPLAAGSAGAAALAAAVAGLPLD